MSDDTCRAGLRRWGLDRAQTTLLAGILLLTLLAYLRSLGNGFVYDDFAAIVRNLPLRRWSFIWESMTRDVWWYYGFGEPPHSSYYRPLQNVWLGLGYQMAGLNPAGWHLLKTLLHLCAVVVSFRLAQLLTASIPTALLVALLFGLLPANGAAVISIQALGEPLAAVLAMGALCAFIRRSKTRRLGMVWPMLLFACATLSHETAVLFPLVIAAYVFILEPVDEGAHASSVGSAFLARRVARAASLSAPFIGVAVLYMGARILVFGPAGVLGLASHKIYMGGSTAAISLFLPRSDLRPLEILMTIPTVLVHYVELLIFPWLAGPAHDVDVVTAPNLGRLWLPLGILASLAIVGYLVFRKSPRSRLYLFCLIWSLIAVAPALSFNHIIALVQDRYLYLASFAFCLWLASCAIQIASASVTRRGAIAVAVMALIAFDVGKLWLIEPIWRDNLTLFTRCVQDSPNSVYYHRLLATTLMTNGDFAGAAPHLRFIYKFKPRDTKGKESAK